MITVGLFGIVILIFILHTIATFLIGYWYNNTSYSEDLSGILMLNIIEIGIVVGLLKYYIG